MLNFNDLRDQVKAWSDKNFGSNDQNARPHRPLLGMFEEAGELVAACEAALDYDRPSEERRKGVEEILDAVADMVIFGADYASRKGWDYEELRTRPLAPEPTLNFGEVHRLMKHLGIMAHCHLKTEQGIRGDATKHDARAQEAMSRVLYNLNAICLQYKTHLQPVVDEVWAKVRLRDFTKNKVNGQVDGNSA